MGIPYRAMMSRPSSAAAAMVSSSMYQEPSKRLWQHISIPMLLAFRQVGCLYFPSVLPQCQAVSHSGTLCQTSAFSEAWPTK